MYATIDTSIPLAIDKSNYHPIPLVIGSSPMTMGDRIRDRLEALGMSQAELARRVGISQPSVNHLVKRGATGSSHLHKIARELETTPAYLTGEIDDPSTGALPAPTAAMIAEQLGLTLIPEIDLHFALGGGSFVDGYVTETLVPYRTDWLHRITRGLPDDIFLTQGDGDSMLPTILDGDDVIVNRAERMITKQDKIWALGYGDLVAIKRVRKMADGTFRLLSDNKEIPPIEALEDELRIIGRVIWIGRRM